MEQKLNSNSSAGTAADSDLQTIVTTSADIAVNPLLAAVIVIPPDYDAGPEYDEGPECEDDGCIFCNDIHCDESCQDNNDF